MRPALAVLAGILLFRRIRRLEDHLAKLEDERGGRHSPRWDT